MLGVGYDRTLGGLEMTLRLRDILLAAAEKQLKTKTPLRENARAMGKLMKEAERLKLVLSANADFIAQIENLAEDQDFKLKVGTIINLSIITKTITIISLTNLISFSFPR